MVREIKIWPFKESDEKNYQNDLFEKKTDSPCLPYNNFKITHLKDYVESATHTLLASKGT